MLKLLIARHGNTFDAGETILRVGAKTDLNLSESGKKQARKLANFIKSKDLFPDYIFTSKLKRTYQTADIINKNLKLNLTIQQKQIFNEIDYGIYDGMPESEVVEKLGKNALKEWQNQDIVPAGWHVNIVLIKQNWLSFGQEIINKYNDTTILVVTSAGIAKFAPYLIGNNPISYNKLKTGSCCLLEYDNNINNSRNPKWEIKFWDKCDC